jgi:RHS repeat-associated protein
MLPGRRVLHLITSVPVALVLLLLVSVATPLRAQSSCASCTKNKAFVTIGFYAKACARYPYEIRIEGGLVSVGDGVCDTTGWTSADRILVDLQPDVTYHFSVDAGETCSSHFNFYDIPEGYKLEIDGVETTTIDKVSERGYGGNGTWNVVVREECNHCGSGPSGSEGGPDVGSAIWSVGLGNLSDGRSAGKLSIRQSQLTATSYTPDALIYSPPGHTDEVDITQTANGNHRQIKVPESLADILVISASEYDIRFYRSTNVGSKDGSGLYMLTGTPFVTYTIKNPDPTTNTRFQILKTESGGPTIVNEYTWDPLIDSWTLSRANGARVDTKLVSYPTETSRTETFIVKEGAQVLSKVARTYFTYSFGEELAYEVMDPDGAALTTTYTYYEDPDEIRWHKLKSISYPDGSWIKYDYDLDGNLALILRPWKDLTLASATEENARATRYTYTNSDGIQTSFTSRFPATVTEKIAGVVAGSTTFNRTATTINGNPAVIETERVYSSASGNLATVTTRYHSTAIASLADRLVSVEYPDGTKDTFVYEKGNYVSNVDPSLSEFIVQPSGLAERETVTSGTVVSPGGVPFKTMKRTSVRDQSGNQVLEESHVYTGTGYERVGWTVFTYDGRGHVTQTVRHNGEVTSAVWNGDRQTSGIDAAGIETIFTYDALGNIRTSTKKGIAAAGGFPAQDDILTTTVYDAAGRFTQETVTAPGFSTTKLTSYDLAGRVKTITQAGLLTSYAYSNGGRTQTMTGPGGATEITDRYLDRQTKSVTGSAVVATYFDYGVNADGKQYTQNYMGSAGLSSPRWTKVTTDWMGRTVSAEKPSFTGVNVVQSFIYNTLGQLQKQTTMAGSRLIADTLYEYDELGRDSRKGLDINGDGVLTVVSTDRLTEKSTVFEKTGSDWFAVNSTSTFLTDNSGTPTAQVQRKRLNNFPANGTQQTIEDVTVTDIAGNNTRSVTVIDRAAKKVTTTTDTADSNVDAVTITVNGLLQSSVPTTPQPATTYSYDSLGRETSITDPRTGTKTRAYNSTSGKLSSTNDGAGTTSYEYYDSGYSSAGLLKTRINPANKKAYFNYNSRGEMVQTWGDTTYPIEYIYDSYGQRTELHTFRGGQNWSAAAWPAAVTGTADVTRWIYQESTGLLTQKQDAALKGTTYTYDELGRLKTRVWARGITCTYNYDPNSGELLTVTYSDGTPTVTFTYDRAGREGSITDAAGAHTLTYNVTGEIQTEQIAGGILDGINITVGYDGFLRRTSVQTALNTTSLSNQNYGYDASSRVDTITSGSQSAGYAYYPTSGLLNTITFTGGHNAARTYDSLGRLESVTITPPAGGAQSYTYSHNNLNQRWRLTREDGSYWSYLYNDRGELTSDKKYWSDNSIVWGAQTEYSFDNLGNRKNAKSGGNQLAALRQSNFTSNSLNQYSQRSVPGAVDVTGTANTAATVTVNTQTTARKSDYFYKELAIDNTSAPAYPQINVIGARNNFGAGGEDAITQKGGRVLLPPAVENFVYDDDGNLTSDGRWSYTWDAENRLASMQAAAGVPVDAKTRLEFSYDYKSRRVQKKIYVWNVGTSSYQLQSVIKFVTEGRNLMAELDGGNLLVRSYTWGPTGLLLLSQAGDTYQYGYDGGNNIVTLVKSATGQIAAAYEYDPFGQTLKSVGEFATQNPFGFSGQYTDKETGLVYYGFRYYNPQVGKWISRDPIAETGGANLYAFVNNDPVGSIDLLGLGRFSQIRDGDLAYSCNCGWLDLGHMSPRGARKLWSDVQSGNGTQSLTKQGFYVRYSQEAGIKPLGIPIMKGVYAEYFVKYNLSLSEKEYVALSIFKEISEAFESSQDGLQDEIMHSSFSEEDLVSNLIGFYMAVKGYSGADVRKWCDIKDVAFSEWLWKKTNGLKKNRAWKPVFKDWGVAYGGCCDKFPQFPSQFQTIADMAQLDRWRRWKEGVDYKPWNIIIRTLIRL